MRWAASDEQDEDPKAHSDQVLDSGSALELLVEGLIIVMDLDKFKEVTRERGFDPYKPNIITGTLTSLVTNFVSKWGGVVIYGLDFSRGTEEAVIEIPYGHEHLGEIARDLEEIKREMNELGASISIAVVRDYVYPELSGTRRVAYSGTAGRRRAWKVVRKVKKSGGNEIAIVE